MSEIPNGETLYRYVRPEAFPNGQSAIPAGVFQDTQLSCDWAKHQATPEESFHVGQGKSRIIVISVCDEIRNPRNPKRTGIIEPDWRQEIVHDPVVDPTHGYLEAHSLIKGRKKKPICDVLIAHSTWRDVLDQQ